MHPAFYIGVVGLAVSGFTFAVFYGSKTVDRDTCWILVGLSLATAVYGAFAGRKDALTGSGRRVKDNYV